MKTGTYPENSSLEDSLINIDDEIKETLSRNEKINSKDKFYQNFANLLHYKYRQQALDNIDPVIAKVNRSENEIYDHKAKDTLLKNVLTSIVGLGGGLGATFGGIKNILTKPFSAIQWLMFVFLGIIPNLLDTLSANDLKKKRYKNGYYMYDKYQGEREFFTPEEQDKLYGEIKKYNPGPHLFWRKAPSNPYEIPPTNIETEDDLLNFENKNDRQNDITLSSSMQEIEPTLKTDVKNNTIDISTEVKRILANTIDDFVQLKGFKKNKIT